MTKNGNKGWYIAKKSKLTMEEYGREDLYVEFLDPTSLPYGESKKLREKYSELNDIQKRIQQDDTAAEDYVPKILELVIDFITGWNMTDPMTDEPLLEPKKPEDFDKLPQDLILKMLTAFTEPMQEAVPKETSTELVPS